MKLAFLIAAHAHPGLLLRLVQRLKSPDCSIFIHIDQGVDIRPFQTAFRAESDVHWVPRIKSRWGTFGQVKASLSLLQTALSTDPDADRFILLSGQDYPLVSPEKMRLFFEAHPTTNFFHFAPMPWKTWGESGGFDRLLRYHFVFGKYDFSYPSDNLPGSRLVHATYRLCQLFLPRTRALPANLTYYGGLNWWNLTRHTASSILDYIEAHPEFTRIFRFTRCSDEIFFQTLLLNAFPELPCVNDDLRCVFWDGRRNQYPAEVILEEFEEIAESGKMFVRKINPDFSAPLLDRIDRELLNHSGSARPAILK